MVFREPPQLKKTVAAQGCLMKKGIESIPVTLIEIFKN